MSNGVWRKLHLEGREVLHHERGEVTIFTEREQVLLVERVDIDLRVFVNDPGRNDDRPSLVGRTDSVDTETTGKTGDGSKETFERLGQVMRDVVFVNLRKR